MTQTYSMAAEDSHNHKKNSMEPLISILIPVKNASPFLEACLESIQGQTLNEWELIAVDDHSLDDSKSILENYASTDRRIRVLVNTGVGIVSALQQALAISNGHYITRMDADDLMPTQRLAKMVNMMQANSSNTIVTGMVKYISKDPVSEGYLKYENWLNTINLDGNQWNQIYRECVIASPNWLIAKQTLLKANGFDDLNYPEDYHLTLRWYQHRFTIKTIPEVTLLWREHTARTSRNSVNYNQEAFFRLKIDHFIHNDLRTNQLILWGKNEKTKLTAQLLNEHNIPFQQFNLSDFHQTKKISSPQVLVGVYPDQEERSKIEDYLTNISLFEGTDWWYI